MESQDEQRTSENDAAEMTKIWLVYTSREVDRDVVGFCQTEEVAKAAAKHIGCRYEPCERVKGCYTQYSITKLPYGSDNQFAINREYKFQEPLEEIISGISYSADPVKAFERLYRESE